MMRKFLENPDINTVIAVFVFIKRNVNIKVLLNIYRFIILFFILKYYGRYLYITPSVLFVMAGAVVVHSCIDKLLVLMGNSLAEEVQDHDARTTDSRSRGLLS